jgi:hypothetical protein
MSAFDEDYNEIPTASGRSFDDGIGKPVNVPGWNPDAKILEARGVKSLEELNEKFCEGKQIKP